ncbi:unannotated protein [freshwater metagenome]|uniref:Unannotated protein n=1 Tax=freshwater metagenome TaxID=449393 RepID=A0A6J7SSP7_9ZZZZ
MVALLRFGNLVEMPLEIFLGGPRGSVDALQHRVLLTPPPIRGGGAHQFKGRDVTSGRKVRSAAEVAPETSAIFVDVVINGELTATYLGALIPIARSFDSHEFTFVRFVGKFFERI